ncbi:hypothetical protein AncyloWKF20_17800 [Ancylobacter sp. WKF20]|uniref:hypothetical protein n=1 Tax=Ancylobacter sp. WKF20 TaxID=3039801 RepID=UPI0024345D47|nr:hypothetical protein [Ancylobacter sp. WKF20]WGD29600.1 hypothetical protein AncyloWKF20_17800 [Ancylobacter sp. WKF20]
MIKPPVWSTERLRGMETSQIKQLLANAEARGVADLAALCQEVLDERGPATRSPTARASSGRTASGASKPSAVTRTTRGGVRELHFVCENDRGVTADGERFFWTGYWIVPEDEAIKAVEAGAKLALHKSRADMSYRQGKIRDYRIAPEDVGKKRNVGIEFLVAADDEPLAWSGEGADEKGYR